VSEVLTRRRAQASAVLASDLLAAEREVQEPEFSRLQALEAYEILDSTAEKAYDDVARLAAFICGTPISVISFIDRDRQWIKSRFSSGVFAEKALTLPRDTMLCEIALEQPDRLILIPDLAHDARFVKDPLLTSPARLRFCAAMPLVTPSGAMLGFLSVMDRRARHLNSDQTSALETLGRQVMELLEMRRTVIGLSHANARLGQQNLTDALTGIPNRRAYDQKLQEEHARARRTRSALSLLLIDIDLFKQYNDTFGHPAGDAALQSVARVLLSSLRAYDFLARYGGEEFAIILPSTDLSDAIVVAERVRGLVANSEFPHRKFTVSIGVAKLDHDSDLKAMVQSADNGLYRAKATGRNKVMVGRLDRTLED